jgi:ankyrin repeat protein/L-ascorbate metabolism protein UlaG (beta-lactamase superfamily)
MHRKTLLTGLCLLATLAIPLQAGEIHEAAQAGDLAKIKDLLAMDDKAIESLDDNGNTPLHMAAFAGQIEAVKLLLESGAVIDSGSPDNSTPLDGAARQGHTEVVRLLLSKGADVNHRDNNGMTPMHFAAYEGKTEVVRALIEAGGNVNTPRSNGSVPLHGAAWRGFMDTVKLLVDNGANVNVANDAQYHPLHGALVGGHLDIASFLLEKGADPDVTTYDGTSALMMALANPALEPLVEPILKGGAEVNAINGYGITPIFQAASTGNVEIVAKLIDRKADVNATAPGGETPLLVAAQAGHEDVAALLIEKGAKTDVHDNDGHTPLLVCAILGQNEVARKIIDKEGDVNAGEPHFGRNALHVAALKGNNELVKLLLAHGAAIDETDGAGHTALYLAAKYGHKDVADTLAAAGASARNLEENYGPAPLLKKSLADNEAVMWYLGHCGWAIKTRNHFLIFDYWNLGRDPNSPALVNGHIDPDEIKGQNVTVFVTHEHEDHYDPAIFDWKDKVKDIRYVYGFRPEELPQNRETGYAGPPYEYVGPREQKSFGDLEIRTIRSIDAGVGFIVKVDGLTIYHAGDHAGWGRTPKENFFNEIDYIAEHVDSLDLAFLNATGDHAIHPERLREGNHYTLEKLKPRVMVPTYGGEREYLYAEVAKDVKEAGFKVGVCCPENRGDCFFYRNGRIQ